MIPGFQRLRVGDAPKVEQLGELLSRVQDNAGKVLDALPPIPLLNGVLLTNVALTVGSTGLNTINHTLGRKLVGWMVTRQRALASLYDGQDSNTTPTLTLVLVTDADVTVDLWVF